MKYFIRTLILILIFVIVGLMYFTAKVNRRQNQLYVFDHLVAHKNRIVPNIIHYIFLGNVAVNFIAFLSMVSSLKIQKPNEMWIHCDSDCSDIKSSYFELIKELAKLRSVKILVKFIPRPTHVYGLPLSSLYHSADVARIQVLMKYGGIYLDTDTLILKPLNSFLHFEMVIGWQDKDSLGTQILVGHKYSKLLYFWMEGYRNYKPRYWYYNAGQYPAQLILENPSLAYSVNESLGVHNLMSELYEENWAGWKDLYTVHLLSRHHASPQQLDEYTVIKNNKTFGDIARWLLFENLPTLILSSPKHFWSFNSSYK